MGMMERGGTNCQITPGDLTVHIAHLGGALCLEKRLSPQKAESAYSDGRLREPSRQGQGSPANSGDISQALHHRRPHLSPHSKLLSPRTSVNEARLPSHGPMWSSFLSPVTLDSDSLGY